jgi:hypothetical protein
MASVSTTGKWSKVVRFEDDDGGGGGGDGGDDEVDDVVGVGLGVVVVVVVDVAGIMGAIMGRGCIENENLRL